MTISGGRTKQLDIILPRHWLYEWFSKFHSCGTYSVLSRIAPTLLCDYKPLPIRAFCGENKCSVWLFIIVWCSLSIRPGM